jgi:hypothetical protein
LYYNKIQKKLEESMVSTLTLSFLLWISAHVCMQIKAARDNNLLDVMELVTVNVSPNCREEDEVSM